MRSPKLGDAFGELEAFFLTVPPCQPRSEARPCQKIKRKVESIKYTSRRERPLKQTVLDAGTDACAHVSRERCLRVRAAELDTNSV